jgi:hypothetical protein
MDEPGGIYGDIMVPDQLDGPGARLGPHGKRAARACEGPRRRARRSGATLSVGALDADDDRAVKL